MSNTKISHLNQKVLTCINKVTPPSQYPSYPEAQQTGVMRNGIVSPIVNWLILTSPYFEDIRDSEYDKGVGMLEFLEAYQKETRDFVLNLKEKDFRELALGAYSEYPYCEDMDNYFNNIKVNGEIRIWNETLQSWLKIENEMLVKKNLQREKRERERRIKNL